METPIAPGLPFHPSMRLTPSNIGTQGGPYCEYCGQLYSDTGFHPGIVNETSESRLVVGSDPVVVNGFNIYV